MKAKAMALFLSCLALQAFSQARADLGALMSNHFIATPTVDQAKSAFGAGDSFGGFGWEIVIDGVGLGGDYLARFNRNDESSWWVEWDGLPLYASIHLLGTNGFIDPFAFAGLGSSGEVGISAANAGDLAISVYPAVGAGVSLKLNALRIGAKLSYALSDSPVPATFIPAHPLGRFKLAVGAGFTIGTKD